MKILILLSTFLLLITACGKQPIPEEPSTGYVRKDAINLSPQRQQEEAMKIFEHILDLIQIKTKEKAFSEIEENYLTIIYNYPKAVLTKEAYIRLLELYITSGSSINFYKAEKLLPHFASAYPDDPMNTKIRQKLDETINK